MSVTVVNVPVRLPKRRIPTAVPAVVRPVRSSTRVEVPPSVRAALPRSRRE
jgi:hypothetical protein